MHKRPNLYYTRYNRYTITGLHDLLKGAYTFKYLIMKTNTIEVHLMEYLNWSNQFKKGDVYYT